MAVIRYLDISDITKITEAVKARQENFSEDLTMSIGVVLMNYGDRYTDVKCVKGEWEGKKINLLVKRDGVPKCPNGHVLMETSQAPFLALVDGKIDA